VTTPDGDLVARGLRDATRATYVQAWRRLEEHALASHSLWALRAHHAVDVDELA
jgi:hypothetical protein